MTETTSNQIGEDFISNIDRVLSQVNEKNESGLFPDLLISFGGHIVSKKIKAWLRKKVDYKHWHISLDDQAMDTYFHLSNHIQLANNQFLKTLIQETKNNSSNFKKQWQKLDINAELLHNKYLESIPYSDFMIFEAIRKMLPKKPLNLHFSNSTPIRYSQLFKYDKQIIIDSNRGVSGIDGSVSTALGASIINQEMTCLVTGDLSFFYDGNALWNKYLHANFRIIVINNGGGGIFRFIDGPMQSKHLDYFETTHQRTAKSLALEAGMEYSSCKNETELDKLLQDFFLPSNQSKLMEVFTPRELNDKVLKEYFSFLRR